ALGGRTRRTLLLRLANGTDEAVNGVTSSAAVGRSAQGGEPLQLPNLDPIPAHQTRTFAIPVSLPPPAFGQYVVYGTIYGAGPPIPFSASTQTKPWLLFFVVVALIVDVIAVLVLRRRRRERVSSLPARYQNATSRETRVEQTWAGFSRSGVAYMVG